MLFKFKQRIENAQLYRRLNNAHNDYDYGDFVDKDVNDDDDDG